MPSPLATLPAYPTFSESVAYQLNGMIVVFVALGALWGLLELMGWMFRRAAPVKTTAAPATLPAEAPLAGPADTPALLLAVISAAIHVTLLGRRHRIVSVTHTADHQDWSREGRRQIFSSHKVR